MSSPPADDLLSRLPAGEAPSEDAVLDAFVGFVAARGLTLYPAQEEAILELLGGKHVVLATPTGSGKSLVAVALLFAGLARRQRSFYTFPVKALASEKFFELCQLFGAHNVGMLTGDASINRDAPIVCATAEILANIALREGERADVDNVVMDEFHYYGDPERGSAWQIPLLALPQAQMLLMSATLGDVTVVTESLEARTERKVSVVRSDQRPVPLDHVYSQTPLHETIRRLFSEGQCPAYVVSFTQRGCAEVAQGLTSFELCTRAQKDAITAAMAGVRFDSPYGADIKRFLRHGVGVHHAGLLPKYRRLIERLAQQGLLSVICGTDTLGVGVNVPIRTVVFTKLCKFDGQSVKRLPVRDFKQIAGRAGRRGYDVRGAVVCQAPEHVIENKILQGKASAGRKVARKKPPERDYVHWDESIFHQLIERPPEPLVSQFKVSHGMLLHLLRSHERRARGGYGALLRLIDACHERPVIKVRLRREAKAFFKALRAAAVIEVWPRVGRRGCDVRVSESLQRDFSLDQSLSLYLVETLPLIPPERPTYALDVLGLCEAILEQPRPVLYAQERKAKDELFARLKAEGAEYDARMAELEKVTYPKPNAELIYDTFNAYARNHPWLADDNIRPKSVAREMYESYASFGDYVKRYGVSSAEGVLLRYLSDAYKTVVQTVPRAYYTDELIDVVSFLRATLQRIDSSLVQEWERMLSPVEPEPQAPAQHYDLARDPKALRARVRAELHLFVKALSLRDYGEAASLLVAAAEDPWTADRIEERMAPFFAEHDRLVFDHSARLADKTELRPLGERSFEARQILVDPSGDNAWYVRARIELPEQPKEEQRLLQLVEIGS